MGPPAIQPGPGGTSHRPAPDLPSPPACQATRPASEFERWRRIVAITVAVGRKRVLAYADHPLTQLPRHGLMLHSDGLYLPPAERRSDVWVGEVEKRDEQR